MFVIEITPLVLHIWHNVNNISRFIECLHHTIVNNLSKYIKTSLRVNLFRYEAKNSNIWLFSRKIFIACVRPMGSSFILPSWLRIFAIRLIVVVVVAWNSSDISSRGRSSLVSPGLSSLCNTHIMYLWYLYSSIYSVFFLNVRRLVRTRLSQILLQICLKTVKVKVWAYLSFYLRYIIRILKKTSKAYVHRRILLVQTFNTTKYPSNYTIKSSGCYYFKDQIS